MKVKRSYAIELNGVLANVGSEFAQPISGRFRYMVSYNKKITDDERTLTLEAFPYDPKFIEYENRRVALLREFGINGQEDLATLDEETRGSLDTRITTLRDEYADAIKTEEERNAERVKFMDEEVELELRRVGIDDVPQIIAPNDWYVWGIIEPLIDEK